MYMYMYMLTSCTLHFADVARLRHESPVYMYEYSIHILFLFSGVAWPQMWRSAWLAVCARRGRRPNVRVLLCGAVTFLWDRERVSNEEVVR